MWYCKIHNFTSKKNIKGDFKWKSFTFVEVNILQQIIKLEYYAKKFTIVQNFLILWHKVELWFLFLSQKSSRKMQNIWFLGEKKVFQRAKNDTFIHKCALFLLAWTNNDSHADKICHLNKYQFIQRLLFYNVLRSSYIYTVLKSQLAPWGPP